MSTNPATRLATSVINRRAQLALSQLEVWQAGGPSNTTLTNIENGRMENLANATARKLDKGLQWPPGTALSIWRGNSISDGILLYDKNEALVDVDDAAFTQAVRDSTARRDAGDPKGMIGLMTQLGALLERRPDLVERLVGFRIIPLEPTAESNVELLEMIRANALSAATGTTEDPIAAHEDGSIGGEQVDRNDT